MKVYSIEELHDAFVHHTIDISQYYQELFVEAQYQQKRLNAFATMTLHQPEIKLKNDSLLCGIPYVLKDNFSTKGIYTTASSHMLENYIPVYDAHIVKSLKMEQACLVGKAAMDELGMGATNMTALTGPVYNPWNTQRIAGGSSGGCAALVASGLIPFAIGSDTGDSIRRPAGFCGVVGMKPTWGRISRYGLIPYAASLDTVGIMARSVKDVAIVLENIAGYDQNDMTSSPLDVPDYKNNLSYDVSHLKIAVIKNVYEKLVDCRIKEIFQRNISLLKKQDAIINEINFPEKYLKVLSSVYQIIANSEATSHHASLDGLKYGLQISGENIDEMIIRSRTEGFHQDTQYRFILGALALKQENQEKMFRKAQKVRRLIVEEVQNIFSDYDLILVPNGHGIAPFVKEAFCQSNTLVDDFLIIANLAGIPSLTLPCGFVDDMPIAINVMGRCFEEQTVLNCAYTLEKLLPYQHQYFRGE